MSWHRSALAVFFCCAATGHAIAQPELPLDVQRGPGAEDCPDAAQLAARIHAIRGDAAAPTDRAYRVRFTRHRARFSAIIRPSSGRGARQLHAGAKTCTPLAKATAVTLALLLDSHAELDTEEATEDKPTAPPPTDSPLPRAAAPVQRNAAASSLRDVTLSVGGAAALGVLRPLAPMLLGDVGLRVNRLRTSVGALWIPPHESDFAPGTVRASLASGTVRGCFAVWQSALELNACSGAFIGRVSAAGTGYTRNVAHSKPSLAIPIELTLSRLSGPVGWELGAAALVPLRRYDYAVAGLGEQYRAPPLGALLSLRGYVLGSW